MKSRLLLILASLGLALALPFSLSAQSVPTTNSAASEALIRGYSQTLLTPANSSAARLNAATKRKQEMLKLAATNPAAFLQLAIPASRQAGLPAAVRAQLEQPLDSNATLYLEVIHIDNFLHPGDSTFNYYLTSPTNHTRRQFYPTKSLGLISGAKLKISGGYALDNSVVANNTNISVMSGGVTVPQTNDHRLLVIPVTFLDTGPPAWTSPQIADLVFNNHFQDFYREQSYGHISFSGDVTDNVAINSNLPGDHNHFCGSPDLWGGVPPDQAVIDYLISHNINLSGYYGVLFILNQNSDHFYRSCSNVGQSQISFNGQTYLLAKTWVSGNTNPDWWLPFPWSGFDFTLSHEIGHSLGLQHGNGWNCGTATLLTSGCDPVSYGNPFDIMGIGSYSTHFASYAKELLGWISPVWDVLTITQSGTYTLNPLESGGSAHKGAKIQTADGQFPFYLEYRRGLGFDSKLDDSSIADNQQGLFVYYSSTDLVDGNTGTPGYAHLLDMRPTSADWHYDETPGGYVDFTDAYHATLNGNNTFSWNVGGQTVTIGPIRSNDASGITFDVALSAVPTYQWWTLY